MAKNGDVMKYLGFGLAAVGIPTLLMGIGKVQEFMATELMSFEFMGIKLGYVLLASASIYAVDQFVVN